STTNCVPYCQLLSPPSQPERAARLVIGSTGSLLKGSFTTFPQRRIALACGIWLGRSASVGAGGGAKVCRWPLDFSVSGCRSHSVAPWGLTVRNSGWEHPDGNGRYGQVLQRRTWLWFHQAG